MVRLALGFMLGCSAVVLLCGSGWAVHRISSWAAYTSGFRDGWEAAEKASWSCFSDCIADGAAEGGLGPAGACACSGDHQDICPR